MPESIICDDSSIDNGGFPMADASHGTFLFAHNYVRQFTIGPYHREQVPLLFSRTLSQCSGHVKKRNRAKKGNFSLGDRGVRTQSKPLAFEVSGTRDMTRPSGETDHAVRPHHRTPYRPSAILR